MHGRGGRLLGLLFLAVGTSAFAGDGDTWRGDLHIDVPATYAPQDTGTLQVSERVSGSFFFKPLLDDGQQPLGLLGFLQHPDVASLTVSGLSFATIAGTAYPWQNTGLTASMGAAVGTASSAISSSYSAGLLHYFGSNLRLELLYLGTRSHAGGTSATDELQLSTAATDHGRLNVALLLEERALLSLSVDMASVRGTARHVLASSANLTTSSSQGLEPDVTASLTGYFGRRFSASLTGGARDLGRTVSESPANTSTRDNALTLFGGAGVQHFVTEAIYLRANYQADWSQQTSGSKAEPSTLVHSLIVTLGGRL